MSEFIYCSVSDKIFEYTRKDTLNEKGDMQNNYYISNGIEVTEVSPLWVFIQIEVRKTAIFLE